MIFKNRNMGAVAAMSLGVALCALSGVSSHADTLSLGGNYNNIGVSTNVTSATTLGGGSITVSSLDSVTLPYVYCIDITHDIGVPNTYTTAVTSNGTVFGSPVTNAGQIAYLVDHYAVAAEGNTDLQEGLQGAIWTELYNSGGQTFTMTQANNTTAAYNDYLTDMTNVGSDAVSNLLWLSPVDGGGNQLQALITGGNGNVTVTSTPEPGALALLLSGGIGAGLLRRRRARK